jgi:hypothetical protein
MTSFFASGTVNLSDWYEFVVLVGVVLLPTETVPCAVSGDRVLGILSSSAHSCASACADTRGGVKLGVGCLKTQTVGFRV